MSVISVHVLARLTRLLFGPLVDLQFVSPILRGYAERKSQI